MSGGAAPDLINPVGIAPYLYEDGAKPVAIVSWPATQAARHFVLRPRTRAAKRSHRNAGFLACRNTVSVFAIRTSVPSPRDEFLQAYVTTQRCPVPAPCPTFIQRREPSLHSSRLRGLRPSVSPSRPATLATRKPSGTAGTTRIRPSAVGLRARATIPATAVPGLAFRRQGGPCIRSADPCRPL